MRKGRTSMGNRPSETRERKSRKTAWLVVAGAVAAAAFTSWYAWERYQASEAAALESLRAAEPLIVGTWLATDERGGEYRLEFHADGTGWSREARVLAKRLPMGTEDNTLAEPRQMRIRTPIARFRYRLVTEQSFAFGFHLWDGHIALRADPVTLFQLAHPIITVSAVELVFHDPADAQKTRVYLRDSEGDIP